MKNTTHFFVSSAAIVAAVLSTGCHTMFRRGGSEVQPADVSTVAPVAIPDADNVGKEGTYKEFVIPEGDAPTNFAIESEGLTGSTGRHVSLPPPELEPELPAPKPAPAGSGYYVVQKGDILGRIANRNGTTVSAIVKANNLKDASKIFVGQKLKIPAASATKASTQAKKAAAPVAKAAKTLPAKDGCIVYVVQNGDILGRIAKKYKTTQNAIMQANGMTNPDKISAGKPIYIPTSVKAPEASKTPAVRVPKAEAPSQNAATPAVKEAPAPVAAPVAPVDDVDDFLSSLGN